MKVKVELTPPDLLCSIGHCPAVLELEDGKIAVIGDKANSTLQATLQERVGPEETVSVISKDFFAVLIEEEIKRRQAMG